MGGGRKKTILNVMKLAGSMFIGAGLVLLNQMILARYLTVKEYGYISSALSLINIAAPLASFGIGGYWLKANSKFKGLNATLVFHSHFIITRTVILTILLVFLIAYWSSIGGEFYYMIIVLILTPVMLNQVSMNLLTSLAQINRDYTKISIAQIAPHVGRLLVGYVGVFWFASLLIAVIGYAIVATILFLQQIRYVVKKTNYSYQEKKSNHKKYRLQLAKSSSPFALNLLLNLSLAQLVIYLVSIMFGFETAGQYSICVAMLQLIFVLPNAVFGQYYLPRYYELIKSDTTRFYMLFKMTLGWSFLSGVLFAGLLVIFGSNIINALFGNKYYMATTFLPILASVIPLRYMSTSVGSMLLAMNKTRGKINSMIGALFVQFIGLALCLVLKMPEMISFTVVATEMMLLMGYLITFNAHTNSFENYRKPQV